MNNFKSHFVFGKQQRNGIFLLCLILVLSLIVTVVIDSRPQAFQLNAEQLARVEAIQQRIDSVKQLQEADTLPKIQPFNPNFITDYRAYVLGIAPEQVDLVYRFRESGQWINSARQFQEVSGINDSLLSLVIPYFKFPEWLDRPKKTLERAKGTPLKRDKKRDLNRATEEELRLVNGIGEVLARRIISYRKRLGGFVVDEQLGEVYGLKPEVVARALDFFTVQTPAIRERWDLNTATASDLATIPYLTFDQAVSLVNYRKQQGGFSSLEELRQIDGLESDKIGRIQLYLYLK
ncbi:ComEA family DNA-binding protein [Croceiramulus getboli]|nr:helix-hairpin-helix domain-containing protein [Flavobacteriaceae bacterium YJPT1-3]